MGLKFLNKKGWHTGSLRNIENVWKAEQKHNVEQSKLEELRKQIHEEREKAEFRQLQEQAGLIPRQERLDFLYESGLGVGKTSEGFKALETPAPAATASANAEASSSKAAAPGALFEEKPQSANDAWRKLHSDPLLLIRQREQEALARIKNNPIKMSMIRKSVEAEKKGSKEDKEQRKKKKHKKKHHHKSRSERSSDSDNSSENGSDKQKRNHVTSDTQKHSRGRHSSKGSSEDEEERTRGRSRHDSKYSSEIEEDRKQSNRGSTKHRYYERDEGKTRQNNQQEYRSRVSGREDDRTRRSYQEQSSRGSERDENTNKQKDQQGYNRKKGVPKMTEEERKAKLKEMQMDAELHEEQRWRRIKHASEADAQEAARASSYKGKNFLDDAQKSIYGTEKGGSSTIEESVRRRAYYSQGGSAAHESNPFRR